MPPVSKFTGTRFITRQSPYGFGVRFAVQEDHSIMAKMTFDRNKEGGYQIVHGGAVAAVLDEAMGVAAFERGHPGYTVTMTYDYKRHIPINAEVTIRAWIDRIEGRKIFAKCEALLEDGKLAVSGHGIFIFSQTLLDHINNNVFSQQE